VAEVRGDAVTVPAERAASPARAVLSITCDEEGKQWVAACSRCLDVSRLTYAAARYDPGVASAWLYRVAGHEEGHAPAVGPGIEVHRDVVAVGGGYYEIRHGVAKVAAVSWVDQHGQRHTPLHDAGGWEDYGGGVLEFRVPVEDLTPVEVWVSAAP
jgi:hypothetical protein